VKAMLRNEKLEIIGYHEKWSATREILRDKNGKRLGVYENDNQVTRDAHGTIIGRGTNPLFRLLPPG
jgi:hypothetical protein